jgi:predicted RND superfamily exporter protein
VWLASAAAAAALAVVIAFVDVEPRVEADFFFSEGDPQLQASRQIEERFVTGRRVILRVADGGLGPDVYRERIGAMTRALGAVEGIANVYSISANDASGPLYRRIVLTPDPSVTNVVLAVDATDPRALVPRIEAVVDSFASDSLAVDVSGAPVIIELVRRSLLRDLVVFSLSAAVVFALLIGIVYRDAAVLIGTLVTCAISIAATLVTIHVMDVSIGLLTANLVTIVFVLTLSHVVFLSANWIRAVAEEPSREAALVRGVRDTLEASFWSMATTLLGFLSLLVASAKPLRELGVAGAVGTVMAMLVTYLVYPAFLARWAKGTRPAGPGARLPSLGGRWGVVAAAGALVVALGAGVARLDTDPGLLTYFKAGTELRDGLERVDRDGGSSALNVLVRDPAGDRLDTSEAYRKLSAYQAALEADPVVGVVLSPAVLIDQARTTPLASFLPIRVLLDVAASPRLGSVALAYVTPDRREGLFAIRVRESVPVASRDSVIARVRAAAERSGLDPVMVGGLYELQRQLGRLIRESLTIGIGGLMLLFLGVAAVVSRSVGTTVRMWLCLLGIPAVVLGTFGWLGIAVDIITSPAANIALAMGVDSTIHLVVRVRRLRAGADQAGVDGSWSLALAQIRGPVLAATSIVCAGFGIFVLSSFPPTQRFGVAVILGTLAAATMTLAVLPRMAGAGGGAGWGVGHEADVAPGPGARPA